MSDLVINYRKVMRCIKINNRDTTLLKNGLSRTVYP